MDVLAPAPAVARLPAHAAVSVGTKDAVSWQMGAVFWGVLLAPVVGCLGPIAAMTLLLVRCEPGAMPRGRRSSSDV